MAPKGRWMWTWGQLLLPARDLENTWDYSKSFLNQDSLFMVQDGEHMKRLSGFKNDLE